MAMKRRLKIDPDIWEETTKYVNKQLATMEKYGARPKLSEQEIDDPAR